MHRWDPKDPDETDDRDLDWTKRLYNEDELAEYNAAIALDPSKAEDVPSTVVMPADAIVTSTFVLPSQVGSANPLVAESASNTATRCKGWWSGGVHKTDYDIVNRVVTSSGRELDETVRFPIRTR
jgi:hypothetical protein